MIVQQRSGSQKSNALNEIKLQIIKFPCSRKHKVISPLSFMKYPPPGSPRPGGHLFYRNNFDKIKSFKFHPFEHIY